LAIKLEKKTLRCGERSHKKATFVRATEKKVGNRCCYGWTGRRLWAREHLALVFPLLWYFVGLVRQK